MSKYDVQRDRMSEQVPELSARSRVAFAVSCAERVLPMAEWYYGGKPHVGLRKAVDLCWNYAEGNSVPKKDLRAAEKLCDKLVDELVDDDEEGAPWHYACMSLLFAVQSTLAPEAKLAQQAYEFAGQAAAAEAVGAQQDTNIQEEVDWQEAALSIALQSTEPTRTVFDGVAGTPQWLTTFLEQNPG